MVAARTDYVAHEARDVLNGTGIPTLSLATGGTQNVVRAGTMHRMKGLEFQAVAVIGVTHGLVPLPSAMTPASEVPLAHDQD